jgi:hypothetical protein
MLPADRQEIVAGEGLRSSDRSRPSPDSRLPSISQGSQPLVSGVGRYPHELLLTGRSNVVFESRRRNGREPRAAQTPEGYCHAGARPSSCKNVTASMKVPENFMGSSLVAT